MEGTGPGQRRSAPGREEEWLGADLADGPWGEPARSASPTVHPGDPAVNARVRRTGPGDEPGMDYTHLGRSGLSVSRLCLGTMNFGPETSEEDSHAIMDRALDLGINFFDTANVYGWAKGEGITEQIVGRWFAQGAAGARRQ